MRRARRQATGDVEEHPGAQKGNLVTRTLLRSLLVVVFLVLAIVPASAQTVPDFPQPATVTRNANLRDGPGTSYAVAGSARAGEAVTLVGENAAGDWYELASGEWIAAFLVEMDAPTAKPALVIRASAAEVAGYQLEVMPTFLILANALERMGALMLIPDPSDGEWVGDLALQFVLIQQAHQDLLDIKPAPGLEALHRQITDGTQDCSDAVDAAVAGIDNVDVDELLRGQALLDSCGAKVRVATEALDAYDPEAVTTPSPTPSPTRTPSPTATRRATATPTPTATQTTRTTTLGPTALRNANLREGPGTDYAAVGSLRAGQAIEAVGRNSAGDWIQLSDGAWVAAFLLSDVPDDLPVTAVAAQLPGGNPTPVPTAAAESAEPMPTPGWQTEQNGIIFSSDCPCDQGDVLNCGDFGIAMSGQACYLRCQELAGYDVHRLDRDKDGSACEWEW